MVDAGNGAVVRLVYLSLLDRCPDQTGYDYWTDQLDQGSDREQFARQLAYSAEALGLQVDRAYQQILGRAPDAAGRAYWVDRLATARSYVELLAFLGNSDEAYGLAGSTSEGFVTFVYDRILGRVPDDGGLAYWTARLEAGVSRGDLVRTFASLNEPLSKLLQMAYEARLDRDPTDAELAASVARLHQSGDFSAEYAVLIASQSFYDRAQTLPNFDDV